MTWTKAKPKRDGLYWVKCPGESVDMVRVAILREEAEVVPCGLCGGSGRRAAYYDSGGYKCMTMSLEEMNDPHYLGNGMWAPRWVPEADCMHCSGRGTITLPRDAAAWYPDSEGSGYDEVPMVRDLDACFEGALWNGPIVPPEAE